MSYLVKMTRNPVQPSDKHVYFENNGAGFYMTLEQWRKMDGPNHILAIVSPSPNGEPAEGT